MNPGNRPHPLRSRSLPPRSLFLRPWTLALGLAAGCTSLSDFKDHDGDGFAYDAGDCNDYDDAIHPDAPELPNGIDDDCDGELDEGTATEVHDEDGDTYTDEAWGGTDCDDRNAEIHPGAEEVCNDGDDNDCDDTRNHCLLEGYVPTEGASARLAGATDDLAGTALAAVPVGDGSHDLLVGAVGRSGSRGAVLYVAGPLSGVVDLQAHDPVLEGEDEGDYLGLALAAGADWTGDDTADMALAAPYNATGGESAGAVYLVSTPLEASGSVADAGLRLTGEALEVAGRALAGAGDLDADGQPDLVVGSPSNESTSDTPSAAHVVLGPVTASAALADLGPRIEAEQALDRAGATLSTGGDPNGDGFDDLLVGAELAESDAGTTGVVYLLAGPITADVVLSDAAWIWTGVESGQQAGSSVSLVGDTDGDGFDDLLVGARRWDAGAEDAGGAYVIHGAHHLEPGSLDTARGWLLGSRSGDRAGSTVAAAGDLDQDGLQDLVLAAGPDNQDPGYAAAWLVWGPVSGTLVLNETVERERGASFTPSLSDSALGASLLGGSDLDADGYPDLVVGASEDADYGDFSGSAFLFQGLGP